MIFLKKIKYQLSIKYVLGEARNYRRIRNHAYVQMIHQVVFTL